MNRLISPSNRLFATLLPLFIVAALFLAFPSGVSHAAGPVTTIELADTVFTQCNSFPGVFEGSFRVIAKDADGLVANDPNPLNFRLVVSTQYGSEVLDISANSTTPQTFAMTFTGSPAIDSGTVEVQLATNQSVTSGQYTWDCVNQNVIPGGGGGGPVFTGDDDRMNLSHGELMAVLYARPDRSGKPAVHVYGISSASTGYLLGVYTYTDFEKFLGKPPSENTKIKSIGKSTLYALTSGEFQINIGPDEKGELHQVVFSGLPPTNIYFR
jgi:hypothetical protein